MRLSDSVLVAVYCTGRDGCIGYQYQILDDIGSVYCEAGRPLLPVSTIDIKPDSGPECGAGQ